MDEPDDPDAWQFVQLYTSWVCHILDIVLSRARKLVGYISDENLYLSDHFFLTIGTDLWRPRVPVAKGGKVQKCKRYIS